MVTEDNKSCQFRMRLEVTFHQKIQYRLVDNGLRHVKFCWKSWTDKLYEIVRCLKAFFLNHQKLWLFLSGSCLIILLFMPFKGITENFHTIYARWYWFEIFYWFIFGKLKLIGLCGKWDVVILPISLVIFFYIWTTKLHKFI